MDSIVHAPSAPLSRSASSLKEVVVTSTKPVVEVRADKIVLNVEGSINAVGQDALELLRKSPGVMVDKDNNLSVSGKNGVQVYIDGRPTPLAGNDLAEYLKTIQSSSSKPSRSSAILLPNTMPQAMPALSISG